MRESSSRSYNTIRHTGERSKQVFADIFGRNAIIVSFLQQSAPYQSVDQRYVPKTPIASRTHLTARVKEEMRNPFRRKSKKAEPETAKQA
jgi:hypothetical protein